MNARILMLIALVVVAAAVALAARPHEATAAERIDRITSELRCPVCQGLSVKDSGSETARQMRDLVAQRVAEGRSDDEIVAEFTSAYGDWILLSPPLGSWAGLIWIAPVALVGAGIAVALARLRRSDAAGERDSPSAPSPNELAALRTRVAREEAADG